MRATPDRKERIMEEKHTPGPWMVCSEKRFNNGAKLIVWTTKGPGHGAVAHVAPYCPPTSGPDLEQKEADARLIAAAPELLEALEKLLGEVRDNDGDVSFSTLGIVDAAIAKAKGATSDE